MFFFCSEMFFFLGIFFKTTSTQFENSISEVFQEFWAIWIELFGNPDRIFGVFDP